jgi:hypothetical protein
MNLKVEKLKKSLLIRSTDRIVIKKVMNPITKQYSFSVVNENQNVLTNETIVTNDIVIDGVKLDFGLI